jgi:hypothetical protein
MKNVKNLLLGMKKLPVTKIDPNVLLLLLVIVFFVLLLATENVIKQTLIPQ